MNTTATARVDMAKLASLNERICQTLDALNQVRLSAHAMAYPTAYAPGFGNPYIQSATFHQPYFSQPAYPHFNMGWNGLGTPVGYGFGTGFGTGYTTPYSMTNPYTVNPGFNYGMAAHTPYMPVNTQANPMTGETFWNGRPQLFPAAI